MKIQWLGTAAAEAWPAIFCQCPVCREAEKRGGRELRSRSGALIDDVLLLDLNPDLYHQKLALGLDLGNVEGVLITHSHGDHFQPVLLSFLRPVNAKREKAAPVRVFASEEVVAGLDAENPYYTVQAVAHGETFETGHHRVTALPAVHGAKMAQFFLIEKAGASLLYAHDTDLFSPEAWDILERAVKKPLGLVSLDCTNGPLPRSYVGHMGFGDNVQIKDELLTRGLADGDTVFVCNHFSHNGGMLYKESVAHMAPHGFEISYDGMVRTI